MDSLLNIQISPLVKSSISFQKGDFSSQAHANKNADPKKPVVEMTTVRVEKEESSNKSNSQEENLMDHPCQEDNILL